MGRPKLYENEAAKHRAYRARSAAETVRVDRRAWEAMEERVRRLSDAFGEAWRAGDDTARGIRALAPHKVLDAPTTLDLLAEWFEAQAARGGRARRPHGRTEEGSAAKA